MLRTLYTARLQLAPTLRAQVSLAAVTARIDGPLAGLAALAALREPSFQPYWATVAHLLKWLGRQDAAVDAYAQAIILTTERPPRVPSSAHVEFVRGAGRHLLRGVK